MRRAPTGRGTDTTAESRVRTGAVLPLDSAVAEVGGQRGRPQCTIFVVETEEALEAYQQGYDLAEEGRHLDAVEAFRRAAALGDPDALLAEGNSLRALERLEEAAEVYTRAEASGDTSAAQGLAITLELLGDLDEAEAAYWRSHACDDPKARAALAHLWRWHGRPDDARALLREAAADGDALAAADLACWLYLDAEHDAQATAALDADPAVEALLRLGAEVDDDACGDLGWMLRRRGDLDGAEQVLRAGHERGATDCSIKLALLLDEDRHDATGAEAVLRVAVEAGELHALANLANLVSDQGRLLEAEQLYRDGAARGDDLAARNLRRLRRDHRRQLGRAHRRAAQATG